MVREYFESPDRGGRGIREQIAGDLQYVGATRQGAVSYSSFSFLKLGRQDTTEDHTNLSVGEPREKIRDPQQQHVIK